MNISQTVSTIAEQVNAGELKLARFLLIQVDDNTLRVKKGKRSMDIEYDYGTDTYTTTLSLPHNKWETATARESGIYGDMLQDLISEFFKFEYVMSGIVGVRG